jgi:hypothetical protein
LQAGQLSSLLDRRDQRRVVGAVSLSSTGDGADGCVLGFGAGAGETAQCRECGRAAEGLNVLQGAVRGAKRAVGIGVLGCIVSWSLSKQEKLGWEGDRLPLALCLTPHRPQSRPARRLHPTRVLRPSPCRVVRSLVLRRLGLLLACGESGVEFHLAELADVMSWRQRPCRGPRDRARAWREAPRRVKSPLLAVVHVINP